MNFVGHGFISKYICKSYFIFYVILLLYITYGYVFIIVIYIDAFLGR